MTCDVCGKPEVRFWAFRVWRCCSKRCRETMAKRYHTMWKRDVSNAELSGKESRREDG